MDDNSKNYFEKKIAELELSAVQQGKVLTDSNVEIMNASATAELALAEFVSAIRAAISVEQKRVFIEAAKKAIIPALIFKPYNVLFPHAVGVMRAVFIFFIIANLAYAQYSTDSHVYGQYFFEILYELGFPVNIIPLGKSLFGMYVVMGLLGIVLEATKRSSKAIKELNKLRKVKFLYSKASNYGEGSSEFPYELLSGPNGDASYDVNEYRFNIADGNLSGCQLLQCCTSEGVAFLLKVPVNGAEQDLNCLIHFDTNESKAFDYKIIQPFFHSQKSLIAEAARKLETITTLVLKHRRAVKLINKLAGKHKQIEGFERNWQEVALTPETLESIMNRVDLFAARDPAAPKGMLLFGPPGTGKTSIAKKIASTAGCSFQSISMSDLKADIIGGTAKQVKQIWKKAKENSPCILFVDECETVFAKRGSHNSDKFNDDLVNTFLSEWEGFDTVQGQVFVIGATNKRQNIDEAVLSRFTSVIEIALPDAACRLRILINEFKRVNVQVEVNDALVKATQGMSGRDLHALATIIRADHSHSEITENVLLQAVRKYRAKSSTDVDQLTWDDIILKSDIINELKLLSKTVKSAEALRAKGLHVPKSMLLFGPPGTGKTQIARVLANESGIAFMSASTADLKAGYLGQSGQKVKELFEKARTQSPCILFIDEIDIVSQKRGDSDRFSEEIVGQLLQEMDGIEAKSGQVFVIGATNIIDGIDSAVLSRFETKIEIPLPDHEARMSIVRHMLSNKPVSIDLDATAHNIAKLTEGLSGRDLATIIKKAEKLAISRAMQGDDDLSDAVISAFDLESACRR